jgi:hypothetical protein
MVFANKYLFVYFSFLFIFFSKIFGLESSFLRRLSLFALCNREGDSSDFDNRDPNLVELGCGGGGGGGTSLERYTD